MLSMYFMHRRFKIWQNRLPEEPACQWGLLAAGIARVATTGIIVSVATEAADQKNPDQPVATTAIAAAQDAVSAAVAATIVAATEQKQKDNPHTAIIAAHKIGTTATAAVAGSQITHNWMPPKLKFIYDVLYAVRFV